MFHLTVIYCRFKFLCFSNFGFNMDEAAFAATRIVGAFVFAFVIFGNMEASTTRRFSTPLTLETIGFRYRYKNYGLWDEIAVK